MTSGLSTRLDDLPNFDAVGRDGEVVVSLGSSRGAASRKRPASGSMSASSRCVVLGVSRNLHNAVVEFNLPFVLDLDKAVGEPAGLNPFGLEPLPGS